MRFPNMLSQHRVFSAFIAVICLAGADAAKPNIWLIVADDLGFGDLGYTGSGIATPNIDSIARNGTVMGHYYVNICCSPTRAMLMTGRYNIRYGLQTQVVPNNKAYGLPLSEVTVADRLKALGYQTHAVGKWHLGLYRWEYTPTFRGFDSFLGYYSGSQDYFTHKDAGFDLHLDANAKCGKGCSQDVSRRFAGNYSTTVFADRALEVIEAHDPDQSPLFLYMPFQSVHCPIEVPPQYVQPYAHLDPNRRMFAGMLAAMDEAVGRVADGLRAKGMYDNTLIVFTTDNGGPVGSRNGHPTGIGCATGSQNWPLRGGKGSYFQGGVRGTSFVAGAGVAASLAGGTNMELAHVTDWLPTLVDAAKGADGAAVVAANGDANQTEPAQSAGPLDGVSLWPFLSTGTNGGAPARDDVLINIERHDPTTAATTTPLQPTCNGVGQYALVRGRYKLLIGGGGQPNDWYHDGLPYNGTEPTPSGGCLVACSATTANASAGCLASPHVQLFDVIADEAERHNLAPSRPDVVQQLLAAIQRYNASTYVEPLYFSHPVEHECPFVDDNGTLTPCDHDPAIIKM